MLARKLSGRGRSALVWGTALFLLGQLSLTVAIEQWRPEWSDPEYGYRLRHLRRRIKEEPQRPLLVVLGSSRIANGFDPDHLPPPSWKDGQGPLVFNMSMTGGTPIIELLILKRLLAVGIHPRWVVIEVLPPFLNHDYAHVADRDSSLAPNRLRRSDLETLDRYAPQHFGYRYRNWFRAHLIPWHANRFSLMNRYAPTLVETTNNLDVVSLRHNLSRHGWLRCPFPSVTQEQYEKYFKVVRDAYSPFLANFRIDPQADRILRELLDTCRQNAISVIGLLRMPEATDFRKLYSPEATRLIDSYLKGLCEEYGTTSIDASTWLSDDCFADGHHLLPHGAERFTLRFWDEVLERYLKSDPSTFALSQTAAP